MIDAISAADLGDTALQSANGLGAPVARIASATSRATPTACAGTEDGHDEVGLKGHLRQGLHVRYARRRRKVPGALAPSGQAGDYPVPHAPRAPSRRRVPCRRGSAMRSFQVPFVRSRAVALVSSGLADGVGEERDALPYLLLVVEAEAQAGLVAAGVVSRREVRSQVIGDA